MASSRRQKLKQAQKQQPRSVQQPRRSPTAKPAISAAISESARVVARLRQHAAVSRAEISKHDKDGSFTIDARIRVNLPSRARVIGKTTDGVVAEERATLRFGTDWPRRAPQIGLRPTFPSHFAHVNRHKRGELVPPCIVESGNTDELLHSRGLDGVIDQLALWLARAAGGQLADYGQGWEPMRRETANGSLEFDAESLIARLPGDGAVLQARATYFANDGWTIVAAEAPYQAPSMFTHKGLKDWESGFTAIFAVRAKLDSNGKPPVFDQYQPDTVTTFRELLELADEFEIDAHALAADMKAFLAASLSKRDEESHSPWKAGFLAGVVVGVERPSPVGGASGQTTELLTYVVRVAADKLEAGLVDESPVDAAMHRQAACPALLSSVSGYLGAGVERKLVFFGCGSLGSKIATHLARAGFGSQTLVDNGWMSSHNPARHALFRGRGNKAEALKDVFTELGHKGVVASQNDVRAVVSGGLELLHQTIPLSASMLIDTTASSAILNALVSSRSLTESGVRLARSALYGRGRAVVLMLEAPARSVRVDDLVAMLFAKAAKNAVLREALAAAGSGLSPLFVGQNCRSVTMTMSDSIVSRAASMVSVELEGWFVSEVPEHGLLAIGIEDETRIGASWERVRAGATVSLSCGIWNVRVLSDVAERIQRDAMKWKPLETGGGLLGSVSHETRTILVSELLDAPSDSSRRRTEFVLGTSGLVEQIRSAADASLGYAGFLGTWHSHPMGGQHSSIDLTTLAGLALQARGSPSVSLVWTPNGFRVEIGQSFA